MLDREGEREQRGPLDIEIISEEFIVMLRQLSYAIKNQLKAPKAPYWGHFFLFAGSLWHKDSWLPCSMHGRPYAIKRAGIP